MAESDIEFGVNGHPLWGYGSMSIPAQLDLIKGLGLKSYRVDLYDASQSSMNLLSTLVSEGNARDIDILPVLIPKARNYDSEGAAYQGAKDMATAYAKKFPGMIWELGNEYDNVAIKSAAVSGESPSHYNDAPYAITKGLIKGMYDGIKVADPTSKGIVGDAGWYHYGYLQRLAADGVKWDITATHWYSNFGSITNVGLKGSGVDALEKHAAFGKPIWITEFNARPGSLGEANEAAWLTKTMAEWNALASKYNIEAAHIYELLDTPQLGDTSEAKYGLASPTGTLKLSGAAVQDYLDDPTSPDPTPVPETPIEDRDYVPPASSLDGTTVSKTGSYTLLADEANLVLTGVQNVSGTGNTGKNTILGNDGHNTLSGNLGDDYVYGALGNDRIYGDNESDHLFGGKGNDLLGGGKGKDFLVGGSGSDRFAYAFISESGRDDSSRDVIQDYSRAEGDVIDLSQIDANTGVRGNQAFEFLHMNAFTGRSGQLHAVMHDGHLMLEGDVDGNRVADFQIDIMGVIKTQDLNLTL